MRLDELVKQYNSEQKLAYGIVFRQDDGSYEGSIDKNDITFENREQINRHPRNFILIEGSQGKQPKIL